MNKKYLGDSVYVEHDGHMLTLTTENGYGASNTIHLEPEVWTNLVLYVSKLRQLARGVDKTKKSPPGHG